MGVGPTAEGRTTLAAATQVDEVGVVAAPAACCQSENSCPMAAAFAASLSRCRREALGLLLFKGAGITVGRKVEAEMVDASELAGVLRE